MSIAEVAPILALIGVLGGAALTYGFGLRSERRKAAIALRKEAYVDFLKSVARLAIYQKSGKEDDALEAMVDLTDAKSRIAVYGSKPVASAVAGFFREHGHTSSEPAMRSFVKIVIIMRRETASRRDNLEGQDIGQIIFNADYG